MLYTAGTNDQALPQDASRAIIQAFNTHSIVMFGEVHENKQEYEFLRALVTSPQFADKVDDIVVEYGNSLYQKAVDRYIAGENVPVEEVQKAWRNTMALGPVSPVYPALYEAVRQVNRGRAGKHQLRILLGDPFINWDKVQSREDVGPYLAHRDEFYASMVKEEVLAKHHRALLIEGWGHFLRSPTGPGYVEKELRAAGATTFLILFGTNAIGGYDDQDKRFDSWKVPALMPLKGTWVGDLAAMPVITGGTTPAGPNPLKLQDAADALLYLGPRDILTAVHMARADLEARHMAAKLRAVSKFFSASQQIFFRQQPKRRSFRAGLAGHLHLCRLRQKAFTILCRLDRRSARILALRSSSACSFASLCSGLLWRKLA